MLLKHQLPERFIWPNLFLLVPRQHELFDDMAAPLPIERSTTEALRRAAERCMKHRKTKVLIIDEAHHILMAKDPARLEFQFEALKSLTIESDVVIVLVGTYRLLAIREGLVSYLVRLARAHSVSPRALIRAEFAKAQPEIADELRPLFFRIAARTIDGLGLYAC